MQISSSSASTSRTILPTERVSSEKLPSLPLEILSHIFSYNHSCTNDSLRLMSKNFYYAEAHEARDRIRKTIKFLTVLSQYDIDPVSTEFTNVKASMALILQEMEQLQDVEKICTVKGIQERKKRLVASEMKIYELLRSLPPLIFDLLKFELTDFHKFFALAAVLKDRVFFLQEIQSNHPWRRMLGNDAMISLARRMIKMNEYDKAFQTGHFITDDENKYKCRGEVGQALAGLGDIEYALKIANIISGLPRQSSVDYKNQVLEEVVKTLTASRIFNRAFEITNSLPDSFRKSSLRTIAGALAESGKIDHAFEIIDSFKEDEYLNVTVHAVSIGLAKFGDITCAINTANSIQEQKDDVLYDIVEALVKLGRFDRVLEVACSIVDEKSKDLALGVIATALAKSGQFEPAFEVARLSSGNDLKSHVQIILGISLAKSREFERAIELANSFEEDGYRTLLLQEIAKALTKAGYINRALEIANSLAAVDKDHCLYAIAMVLAKNKNLDLSREVAESIVDKSLKKQAYYRIPKGVSKLILYRS